MCSLSYPATQSNKRSFGTTFRVLCFVCLQQTHVMLDSQCAVHCRKHALSDQENACFKDNCPHDHDLICQNCRSLEKVKALWYSGLKKSV